MMDLHPLDPNEGPPAPHALIIEDSQNATEGFKVAKRPASEIYAEHLRETLESEGHFGSLWGRSTQMLRIAAASNRDPLQAVADSHLREDLLYRLNVFPIHMPALRERPEDIPLIANHFLDDVAQREYQAKNLSHAAVAQLSLYHWSGNARELRNIVHRAYVMAGENNTIVDSCLPATCAPVPGTRVGPP